MLDKHANTLGRPARELVGDSAYGSEAAIRECHARGVQPTFNYRRRGNMTGGFPVEAFRYDRDRDLYVCPAGLEMRRVAENFSLRRTRYGPKFGSCARCVLKPQCCPTNQRDRKVDRSWGADIIDDARERIESRIGKARLRRRQVVSERLMAELKTKHGFERAQFRRRASVQIQALLTAAVVNLKQLLKRHPEAQSGQAVGLRVLTAALRDGFCVRLTVRFDLRRADPFRLGIVT